MKEEISRGLYHQLKENKLGTKYPLSKEDLKNKIKEHFDKVFENSNREISPFWEYQTWEENGKQYECWKNGGITFGRGAMEMMDKIMKEELEKI